MGGKEKKGRKREEGTGGEEWRGRGWEGKGEGKKGEGRGGEKGGVWRGPESGLPRVPRWLSAGLIVTMALFCIVCQI